MIFLINRCRVQGVDLTFEILRCRMLYRYRNVWITKFVEPWKIVVLTERHLIIVSVTIDIKEGISRGLASIVCLFDNIMQRLQSLLQIMMIDWFQALKPGVWVSIIHHLNRSKIHHHFFDLIYAIDSCLIHLRCYRLFCLLLILHVDICIDFRRKHYIFSPILDKQLLNIFLFPYACSLKEGHIRLWLNILKTYFPLIWGHRI